MNPSTAQGLVLVDELVRCGVTDVVLAPGSRSAPLALAAAAADAAGRLRLHVRIDERSAGFLALGLAQVSGRAVAVVTTSGTAARTSLPALTEAAYAGVPLIAITADRPPELRDTGANQTIDQVRMYGTAVRWSHDLGVAEARAGPGRLLAQRRGPGRRRRDRGRRPRAGPPQRAAARRRWSPTATPSGSSRSG